MRATAAEVDLGLFQQKPGSLRGESIRGCTF